MRRSSELRVSLAPFLAALLLLSEPGSALAQESTVPAREGNTYDWRDHQPTAAAPSAQASRQVEDQVKALLQQSDELDRTFDHKEGADPARQ
jgi:hypothetical protein